MAAKLRPFAEQSLRLLARESPWHAAALGEALAEQRIEVLIGLERFALIVVCGKPTLTDVVARPTARLRCEPRAILPLLSGRSSPLSALESGDVDVQAPIAVFLLLANGLAIYLAGALRSPTHLDLLHQLENLHHDPTSPQ